MSKANAELLNNIGNFVNRMVKFVNAKYDSILPDPKEGKLDYLSGPYPFAEEDAAFVSEINAFIASYNESMAHQKIRAGLATAMQISSRGNLFISENRLDNTLLANNPARCAEVVLIVINLIYTLSALLHPFMPSTSDGIIAQLDATPRSIPDEFSIDLLPGHKIGTAAYLFTRIDPKQVPLWRAQYGGAAAQAALAAAEAEPKLSKKAQAKLAKEAKAAAKAAAEVEGSALPKTEEQLALEVQIKSQGDVVRRLKTGQAQEGESVDEELAKLKVLKEELKEITDSLKAASLQ